MYTLSGCLNEKRTRNSNANRFFFISLVGKQVYGLPDTEGLPLLMDVSNAKDRAKPLPTVSCRKFTKKRKSVSYS